MGYKRTELLQALDMLDVVSSLGLEQFQTGTRIRIRCPQHTNGVDKHPSCEIFRDKKTYKCWSCGASGSVIDLVMAVRGSDYHDALEFLASLTGNSDAYKEDDSYRKKAKKIPFLTLEEQNLLGLRNEPVYVSSNMKVGREVGEQSEEIAEDLYIDKKLSMGSPLRLLYDTDEDLYKNIIKEKCINSAKSLNKRIQRLQGYTELTTFVEEAKENLDKIKIIYIAVGGRLSDFPKPNPYYAAICKFGGRKYENENRL